MRRLSRLAPLVLLALILVSCATNPATGRRQLILVSEDQEIRLGVEADPQIRAEYGVYEDATLGPLVDRVGRSLASVSERPNLPYSFTLLDSPVVNAFALPGGPIYATRGLLAYADDEAELAGVLGHEVGHVIARHGAEQMSRAQLTQIGLGIATIASPEVGRYADLLGAGAGLMLLRFGRDAERESDRLGIRYLGRSGYDPFGLPRYLAVLDRLSGGREQVLPSWLSTHPDPGERVSTTGALAAPVLERLRAANTSPRRARSEFLASLDGIVYGENPREGFRKGTTFHHPELAFRYDVPEPWSTVNTRSFVATLDDRQNPTVQHVLRLVPPDKAEGLSPEQYASKVASSSPQVRLAGSGQTINGLPAWIGEAQITSGGKTSRALVAWIRHDGRMYEMTGGWATNATRENVAGLESAIRSFRRETDASILSVKPVLLDVESAPAGRTLAQICRERGSGLGAECDEIATLNRIGVDEPLEAGARLKLPERQHPAFP